MSKYIQLVKINLKNILNLNKFSSFTLKKKIFIILLALYISASVIGSLLFYTKILYDYLLKFNLTDVIMPAFIFMIAMMSIMFSLFNSKNLIFNNKDDSLLLSLPVTKYQVMLSRFTVLYLMNLLVSFVLLLPVTIYYGVLINASFNFYLLFIINLILIPIIPTIIIVIFAYLVAVFTSYFNKKNVIEIIFSLVMLFLLLIFTSNAEKILKFLIADQDLIIKIIKYGFYPIYLTYFIFKDVDYLRLFYLILINISAIIFFTYLFSIKYYQILNNLARYKHSRSFIYDNKLKSVKKTLFIKELNKYFASPIYFLNTSFGVIMLLAIAIATCFYDSKTIISVLDAEEFNLSIEWLILSLVLIVSAISNTTSSSISLEGKNLWIIKNLPVKIKDIFIAKFLLSIFVIIPVTIFSVFILGYNLSLNFTFIISMVLLIIITAVLSSLFGLLINLIFPLLNFNNEAQVVKQSVSSLIGVLVPMTVIIGSVITFNYLKINVYLYMLFLGMIFILLIFILFYLLMNTGIKKFQELL